MSRNCGNRQSAITAGIIFPNHLAYRNGKLVSVSDTTCPLNCLLFSAGAAPTSELLHQHSFYANLWFVGLDLAVDLPPTKGLDRLGNEFSGQLHLLGARQTTAFLPCASVVWDCGGFVSDGDPVMLGKTIQ